MAHASNEFQKARSCQEKKCERPEEQKPEAEILAYSSENEVDSVSNYGSSVDSDGKQATESFSSQLSHRRTSLSEPDSCCDSSESSTENYFSSRSRKPRCQKTPGSLSKIFGRTNSSASVDELCQGPSDRKYSEESTSSRGSNKVGFRKCLNCNKLYAGVEEADLLDTFGNHRGRFCSGECHITNLSSALYKRKLEQASRHGMDSKISCH